MPDRFIVSERGIEGLMRDGSAIPWFYAHQKILTLLNLAYESGYADGFREVLGAMRPHTTPSESEVALDAAIDKMLDSGDLDLQPRRTESATYAALEHAGKLNGDGTVRP